MEILFSQRREDAQECSTWWSQLPKYLKEEALAWLPAERLCKYCVVCKDWNALFSSKNFITNDWVVAPPNKKAWLVLFHSRSNSLSCMAYCFFTATWKRLSLAFLKKQYEVHSFWVHASAAGLFVATIQSFVIGRLVNLHIVCNPITGKSIELPRIDDGDIWAMTIIAEQGHSQNVDTFKVIALVGMAHGDRVEIYDSNLESWSTAGHFAQNVPTFWEKLIVASWDILYWRCMYTNSSTCGIMAFSIRNETSVFTPLPLQDVDELNRRDVLFRCGSRVFVGSCISVGVGVIIISELQISHSSMVTLTEITRMSPSILDPIRMDFRHFQSFRFDFEAIGNLVCIRHGRGFDNGVLVYNLSQNIWRWLPRCPMPDDWEEWDTPPGFFVLQPRLDMEI